MENVNMNKVIKNRHNRWFTLIILILGGGTIFKLSSLKDAFYVPMQEFMGLSNTQIGFGLSVYAIIQTIGLFFSVYISDRFSKKKLIPLSLIAVGILGFAFSTLPDYTGYLFIMGSLAFFAEVVYWPVLLKTVRLLGSDDEQGRMFGFLEAGRGVVDTIVAFTALFVFSKFGKDAKALSAAIVFYSIIVIIVGFITYFFLEDDVIKDVDEKGNVVGKNKATWLGVKKAIRMKEIWLASLLIFFIYSVYCGLTYFIPFLKDIYHLPITLVGAYGIINQYGLKMVGGPFGGLLADKVFKSSIKYIRFAGILSAIAMTAILFLPHETLNVYLGMCITLGFGAIIFTMRAVFFAPIDEIKVPRDISGAAMSIASLVGYAPSLFAFVLYGNLLDRFPGMTGYRYVFTIMIGFSILVFITAAILNNMNKKGELHEKE
ncbi:MAG: MFS transporter [Tissierellia bacterium]|nr:MFS transporter [Tissierellia bacterium]